MSKMSDLYSDMHRAEALMDQELNIKFRIYEAFAVTVKELSERNKTFETALRAIQNYDRDTVCYDASDVAAMQDIAFSALTGEIKDGSGN